MRPLYAILLDGGFMRTNLQRRADTGFSAEAIVNECDRLRKHESVAGYELLRIFYYDSLPTDADLVSPVSEQPYKVLSDRRFSDTKPLLDKLILQQDFALRIGELSVGQQSWRLKSTVVKKLAKAPRPLTDDDFTLNAQQKGVDMRIGMDMARLALRQMVRAVIVVTGDTDFVPAFKFVRREGVRVVLDLLGEKGRTTLKQHSDLVI